MLNILKLKPALWLLKKISLRKYTLKYLRIKRHNVSNLCSNGSEKDVCMCVSPCPEVLSTMHDPEHFPSCTITATRVPWRAVLNTISSISLLSFSSCEIYAAE